MFQITRIFVFIIWAMDVEGNIAGFILLPLTVVFAFVLLPINAVRIFTIDEYMKKNEQIL